MALDSVLIFMLLSFIPQVSCYVCYECTSLDQEWCTQHFADTDMTPYHDNVVNCTGNCLKMTAHISETQHFYVRTCDVTEGFPGSCNTGSQVLGIPTSTVCVCSGDRCNNGNAIAKEIDNFVFFNFIIYFVLHFGF